MMTKRAILVLADGSVYEGSSFGAEADAIGETVFNTSMTGYQEMLTDPSYAGQIVIPTYPLIGNYGTNEQDIESSRIQVSGFVVREDCEQPSHYRNDRTIHEYLAESSIPGIYGVDTRAITRKLRSAGVMMGMITSSKTPQEALEEIKKSPNYGEIDFVRQVSTDKPYHWQTEQADAPPTRIAALDCGLKYNILRLMCQRGCAVTVVPCTTSAEEILDLQEDRVRSPFDGRDPPGLAFAYHVGRHLREEPRLMFHPRQGNITLQAPGLWIAGEDPIH